MNQRIATILILLASSLPLAAHAQVGIPCTIAAGNSSGTCASEATLASLQMYLETGQSTSIMGNVAGGGLISQMSTLNAQISALRKQAQNDLGNQDVRNRALATERAILESIEKVTRPISARECRSVAASSGAFGGGAGGGGAGNNTTRAAGEAAKVLEPEMLTPATENDYVARLVLSEKSRNYCTQEDANNKVPVRGGVCSGPGSLPGANNNPQSLVRGATQDPAVRPGNFSIKSGMANDQYAAAIDYVRYSMPFPAPKVNAASKDNPAVKRYLVMQRRYNSRSMAVVYGLTTILAESVSLPSSHPFVTNVWNSDETGADLKKDYIELNQGIEYPTEPSERELMHLLVKRQFATTLTEQDMKGEDADYFAKRSLEVDKINAYLALKLNEKSEWSNIMLAHILSNDIDPVDRKKLITEATAIQ